MSEDRLKILERLAAGELTAEQAAELLNRPAAASEPPAAQAPPIPPAPEPPPQKESLAEPPPPSAANPARRLRIQVHDKSLDRPRVQISVPVGLLKFGLSIGERFAPELKGWNLADLDIDIDDEDERVRIFVE